MTQKSSYVLIHQFIHCSIISYMYILFTCYLQNMSVAFESESLFKDNCLPWTLDFGVHHLRVIVLIGSPSFEGITSPSLAPVICKLVIKSFLHIYKQFSLRETIQFSLRETIQFSLRETISVSHHSRLMFENLFIVYGHKTVCLYSFSCIATIIKIFKCSVRPKITHVL